MLEQSGTTCGYVNKSQVEVIRPIHHQFLVDIYFRIKANFRIPVLKTIALQLIILSMFVVGCNNPETNSGKREKDSHWQGTLISGSPGNLPEKLNSDTNSHNPNHSPKKND